MHYYRLPVLSVLIAAHLAGLATPTPLAPPWDDMHVKHAWNAVQSNWESLGPPPPGTTIDLHVALKPHNENALIDTLYEVSTPGHQKYGAYLSKEEVAKIVAPHPDTFELVRSWLAHHGVQSSSSSTTHGGSWLTLTGVPVSKANELLGASYQLYRYSGTNDTAILRTVGYALPTVLHAHVQTVAPTTLFASARTLRQQTPHRDSVGTEGMPAKAAASRDLQVGPGILRWMYTTFYYIPAATDRNVLGIVGFGNESPSRTDLATFMNVFRTEGGTASFTVEQVNSGGSQSHLSREANLGMQYSQGIAYPTPHVYYSTGGSMMLSPLGQPALGDVFLAWLAHVLSQPNIPQTISIPFGVNEKSVPPEYASSVCLLFAQLGARGVSVLFKSGDDGVGAGDCKLNDGSGRVQFIPTFPASCPWVTSVGGTTNSPEVAAGLSGGGFSDYFPRPNYQKDAVPAYLRRLGGQYHGLYAPAGRGIPDIASQALEYPVVVSVGPSINFERFSSTSCAVTTAASVISLLNDYLLSKGRPPLGFLNPWLYKNEVRAMGLTDIISGANPGCGTFGFSAAIGWDPVTGLGTPSFTGLLNALVYLAGAGN